jgi:4a-hydroxytetrahydrobiopterin dehydratase
MAYFYNGDMAGRERLPDDELRAAVGSLPGWKLERDKLHKQFTFADFARAFGFMATAAVLIEKMNHHPEWSNVYNRVDVHLTTHDAGGVSQRDIELARLLDSISAPLVANR